MIVCDRNFSSAVFRQAIICCRGVILIFIVTSYRFCEPSHKDLIFDVSLDFVRLPLVLYRKTVSFILVLIVSQDWFLCFLSFDSFYLYICQLLLGDLKNVRTIR